MAAGAVSRLSTVVTLPSFVLMTMNPPPPIPDENGSTTPRTPAAATAASTALPPSRRDCSAVPVASASTLEAAPPVPVAVDSAATAGAAAPSAAMRRAARTTRRRMPPRLPGDPRPHAGEEVQDPAPRVLARVGELVVLAVEERVRRAGVHDDLVVGAAGVQGLLELRHGLHRDPGVVAAEETEDRQLHVGHRVDRGGDDPGQRSLRGGHDAPVEPDDRVEADVVARGRVERLRAPEAEADHDHVPDPGALAKRSAARGDVGLDARD